MDYTGAEQDGSGLSDVSTPDNTPGAVQPQVTNGSQTPPQTEANKALVKQIQEEIRKNIKHYKKAHDRMRRDMRVAMYGADKDWSDKKYTANIIGRHIKTKTAALYAKNPKIVAQRRETLDFALWDESDHSIKIAMAILQQGIMGQGMGPTIGAPAGPPTAPPPMPGAPPAPGMPPAPPMAPPAPQGGPLAPSIAPGPGMVDPKSGQPITSNPMTGLPGSVAPQLPPGFQEAQALLADFQQGMQRRQFIKKLGKTLETLFTQSLREQKPLDFKMAMKQLVRRCLTTGAGFVELDYQRTTGPRPGITEKLADFRARLDHLTQLQEDVQEGEIGQDDAEMEELQASIKSLMQEPEIVLRQGLIFDYPQSTQVIPDRLCKSLVGFVGSRHLTIQYIYSKEEAEELFGVELDKSYTKYTIDGIKGDSMANDADESFNQLDMKFDNDGSNSKKCNDMVCIWKHYDKLSGLVYYVCDGYPGFLREPAAPSVFVSDFWPVYALTFNAVESEDEVFPPSDVTLLLHMQQEYNRSREGKREHRKAARPRWGYAKGRLDDDDIESFKRAEPFEVFGLNMDAGDKLHDILQPVPVPGVDPNLYDVGEIWNDLQVVAGAQEAQLGGTSKSTATESSIAASSSATSDGSSIDDLDAFLSCISRGGGQILMREMPQDEVMRLVGPGAVWPQETLTDIFDELFLEVEAGSTGRPNQAVEISNWKTMLPFLIQMGSIPSTWLARETLRRLDDKMDLTEAVVDGLPSLVAQNAMAGTQPQPAPAPAANGQHNNPTQQGQHGQNNGPAAPGGPTGSSAPMGDNH